MARTQNSFLTNETDALVPLHNWENNSTIVDLPATLGDIKSLRNLVLGEILEALGAPVPTGVDLRKEGLRVALGLKPPMSRSYT